MKRFALILTLVLAIPASASAQVLTPHVKSFIPTFALSTKQLDRIERDAQVILAHEGFTVHYQDTGIGHRLFLMSGFQEYEVLGFEPPQQVYSYARFEYVRWSTPIRTAFRLALATLESYGIRR